MKTSFGPAPVRALPYVEGQTRRIKAEPTKLSGVALRVMAASGNFSTRRAAASSSSSLWFGALALLLIAGAIAVTNSDALTVDRSSDRAAAATSSPLPDQVQAQGSGQRALPAAPAAMPAVAPEAAPAAAPATAPAPEVARAPALDPQDRFEIERIHRWAASAASDLAPAAGTQTR